MRFLSGKERNEVRRLLRNLLKAGRLQARVTYYQELDGPDYRTPDANWVDAKQLLEVGDLKADGCYSGVYWSEEDKVYEVGAHWKTIQVRVAA